MEHFCHQNVRIHNCYYIDESYINTAGGTIEDDGAGLYLDYPAVKVGTTNVNVNYGFWNALTNTPTLANVDFTYLVENKEYKVTVAGTQDFGAGNITFGVGDIISNDGLIWYKKVDNNQSGGTASPTNGGVFDGTLSLDNREFTFYTAYDLSVDGGITFALGGNEVNFGQDYVRLISDGVTPFTTDVNIGDIFNEIPSNLPVDYILDAGEYSMYIWKTPNGVAFSLNPVVNVAPPPTNDFPHANDFVVLMNREISTPTLNGTGVTEIPNLSDVSNPYQNVQNLNQPQDDDVNKYLIFDDDAYMDMPTDVVFNQGNVSLVLSGEFDNNASSLRVLGYHIRGTSTSQNQIIEFRSNQTDIFTYGFKPNAGLVPDSQGSRPINSFVGKGTIIFTYDAANSVATFRYDLENYTATKTIALANNPITQSLLTTLKVTSGVGATCKIKSYGITNRVLTTTEQDDVITYCNNQLGI